MNENKMCVLRKKCLMIPIYAVPPDLPAHPYSLPRGPWPEHELARGERGHNGSRGGWCTGRAGGRTR